MSAWRDLDAFKRRVIDNTPTFDQAELAAIGRVVKDAPATKMSDGNVQLSVSADIGTRAAKLLEPNEIGLMGWRVLMTRQSLADHVHYHVSASPFPRGRSTTPHDAIVLQRIAYRLGCVAGPHPSASEVRHYIWQEPVS